MRRLHNTYHVSSRAPETRKLTIDIFEQVSFSPYIFLNDFTAIMAWVRTRNRHLDPNFWQCEIYHVRTFFFCVASWLFHITRCSFTTCLSHEESLAGGLHRKSHFEFVLIIFYDFYLQLINSDNADSSLADKNLGKLSSWRYTSSE